MVLGLIRLELIRIEILQFYGFRSDLDSKVSNVVFTDEILVLASGLNAVYLKDQ